MAKDNRFELWYRVFYDIFFNTSWYALNMLKIKKNYLPKFKKKFLDFYIQTKQGKK